MTEREMLIAKANEEVEIQRMLADACEDEGDLEGAADCMKLVILLRDLVAALAQQQEAEGIQQIGWTNAAQVSYVKDDSGLVYPDQDHDCNIPVFIPVPPPEWKPACGCRFENEHSGSVLLCSACSKLPCHNRLSAAEEEGK